MPAVPRSGGRGPALGLGLACFALAACASTTPASTPGPVTGREPVPTPGPPVNPWVEPAREVLVQHCGRCHRGDLDTSLKGALAVFDLTQPVWYANLRPAQYDGILERVHEASVIAPEDVATMETFVACARGGACPTPP